MIDRVEAMYKCIVVALVTNNDGGTQSGRKKTVEQRPWLFGPACCGHQVRIPIFKSTIEILTSRFILI